jgi:hypothetical protein
MTCLDYAYFGDDPGVRKREAWRVDAATCARPDFAALIFKKAVAARIIIDKAGGRNEMPMGLFMRKNKWRGVAAATMTCGLAAAAVAQDISDKSVEAFMEYAWSMTPAKFTKPTGAVVEINKKERDKVVVPIDVAREVIRAGRMTAHAQLCDLPELQVLNYRSLMKRESEKKKWSEQQMIYVNQLHLTTVMLLTGKIKLVEQEGGAKQPVVEDTRAADSKSCTDEQRTKVKALIDTYIKSGPPVSLDAPPASAPVAAAPQSATPAAAPAPPPAAPTAPPAKKP